LFAIVGEVHGKTPSHDIIAAIVQTKMGEMGMTSIGTMGVLLKMKIWLCNDLKDWILSEM